MTQNLQHQQMQQPHPVARDHETRLGILENAVSGIGSRLDAIANKLDNQGKTPWGTIIAAFFGAIGLIVTIVSTIGALAFSPLSSGIADVKASIVKFEGKTERFMTREEIEARIEGQRMAIGDKFAAATDRRNDLQAKTDERIARVERDFDGLAKQVVPRGEHDTIRQMQQRDYDLLRNRIERVEGWFEKRTDGLGREVERLSEHTLPRAEALSRNDAQDRAIGALQRRIDALEAPPRR